MYTEREWLLTYTYPHTNIYTLTLPHTLHRLLCGPHRGGGCLSWNTPGVFQNVLCLSTLCPKDVSTQENVSVYCMQSVIKGRG